MKAPSPAEQSHATKAGQGSPTPTAAPKITDIQPADLRSTERLLALYRQAVARNLIADTQAAELNFLALAERARAKGHDAARLFVWLLRHQRFDFITQSDEDAAAHRLREHRSGPTTRRPASVEPGEPSTNLTDFSPTAHRVRACLLAASRTGHDPATIAHQAWGWTEAEWLAKHHEWQQRHALA